MASAIKCKHCGERLETGFSIVTALGMLLCVGGLSAALYYGNMDASRVDDFVLQHVPRIGLFISLGIAAVGSVVVFIGEGLKRLRYRK